jgi:hypothetical protein
MRNEVHVNIEGQEFRFSLDGQPPMTNEAARRWLDEQFTAMECEPLRASGKLLMADKVVVVARDAGARRFADPAWGNTFAAAASAALGRPLVRVDVGTLSVTY